MSNPVCVGVDIGTTGLKAVVVRTDGQLLRESAVRYPTSLAGLGAEQDPQAWVAAAGTALRSVLQEGEDVAAVAVTSQGPTLVALDAAGDPVGPALTWIDRRATSEAAEIGSALPPQRNGPDPYFGTAKLLWWQRRGDLARTRVVLPANSYLAYRLCGAPSFDDSTAAFFPGWDDGFDDRLSAMGVPTGQLPDAVPCSTVIGQVHAAAAELTGLPAGTPVAAGGIDAVGAALEAGLVSPGDGVAEMTGFSTVSIQPVPRGTAVPGMIHTRHCVPDTDLLLTASVSTGAVVDWLARLTGRAGPAELDAEVPARRPGRLLLLPSFAGERTPTWDPAARGAIAGLDLDVTPGDLLLAAFEGTALALRTNLEAVAAVVPSAGPLLALGGGARSAHWPQVKADVLGREVHVPVSGSGAAHGAALLAGLAVGVWASAEETRGATRTIARSYQPDQARHEAYTRRLAAAVRLRDLLPPTTDVLSNDVLSTDLQSERSPA